MSRLIDCTSSVVSLSHAVQQEAPVFLLQLPSYCHDGYGSLDGSRGVPLSCCFFSNLTTGMIVRYGAATGAGEGCFVEKSGGGGVAVLRGTMETIDTLCCTCDGRHRAFNVQHKKS